MLTVPRASVVSIQSIENFRKPLQLFELINPTIPILVDHPTGQKLSL